MGWSSASCTSRPPRPTSRNYKTARHRSSLSLSLWLTTMVRTSCSGTEVLTFPNMKFSLPDLTKTENLLKLDLLVAALTFLPEVLTSPVLQYGQSCWILPCMHLPDTA